MVLGTLSLATCLIAHLPSQGIGGLRLGWSPSTSCAQVKGGKYHTWLTFATYHYSPKQCEWRKVMQKEGMEICVNVKGYSLGLATCDINFQWRGESLTWNRCCFFKMALGGDGWEWRKDGVMAKASIFGICHYIKWCQNKEVEDVQVIGS